MTRKISRAAAMWFKVAVVVAAVLVQLSGNMSHIFNFNILCRKQAKYKSGLLNKDTILWL